MSQEAGGTEKEEEKREKRMWYVEGIRLPQEGVEDLRVGQGHDQHISVRDVGEILAPHEIDVLRPRGRGELFDHHRSLVLFSPIPQTQGHGWRCRGQ